MISAARVSVCSFVASAAANSAITEIARRNDIVPPGRHDVVPSRDFRDGAVRGRARDERAHAHSGGTDHPGRFLLAARRIPRASCAVFPLGDRWRGWRGLYLSHFEHNEHGGPFDAGFDAADVSAHAG